MPVTVSVKPAPPAVAEDGLRLVMAGAGLGALTVCVSVPNALAALVPSPP